MARGVAAQQLGPGDHGSTYGGNPLCCAAAAAVLETLAQEDMLQRADMLRAALLNAFDSKIEDSGMVSDVRGMGLMLGIQPSMETDRIVRLGLERGLLLNIAGGDTIRVLPPLVMTIEQAAELGSGIAGILNDIARIEGKL